MCFIFFFSSRRRHTRYIGDWSSDVCSSDLVAGEFFRQKGVQSRPIHAHGIDLVTDGPHVFTDGVHGEAFEQVFRPGMVFMAERSEERRVGKEGRSRSARERQGKIDGTSSGE